MPSDRPAIPTQFAQDLAVRVNDLIADPAKGRRFGQAGRQRVLEHFSWATIAEETVSLYDRLLNG